MLKVRGSRKSYDLGNIFVLAVGYKGQKHTPKCQSTVAPRHRLRHGHQSRRQTLTGTGNKTGIAKQAPTSPVDPDRHGYENRPRLRNRNDRFTLPGTCTSNRYQNLPEDDRHIQNQHLNRHKAAATSSPKNRYICNRHLKNKQVWEFSEWTKKIKYFRR